LEVQRYDTKFKNFQIHPEKVQIYEANKKTTNKNDQSFDIFEFSFLNLQRMKN